MASVTELAGKAIDVATFNALMLAVLIVELLMVVVVKVVVAEKVFKPVKVWLLAR